jgi:sulfhydrogenase subunit beta (sulfur reductase)
MNYYITQTNWMLFLQYLINHFSVYGLIPKEANLFWRKLNADNLGEIVPNRYRAIQPIKGFFFPAKEEVTNEPDKKGSILIGVKSCDIGHLDITDPMFIGGPVVDAYYSAKRESTYIISSDCDAYVPSCFCTQIERAPYPLKGFDLNLTPIRSGYIVEVGSKKGEELIGFKKNLFQKPQPENLRERDKLRDKMVKAVQENNKAFTWSGPKQIVRKGYRSEKWKTEVAATCVECDGCRFTCGTCYCFILAESAKNWERIRTWDSCQSTGYGRVAGNANPRKTRAERLRNFYTCKLIYRHENFGQYACTGCGRCIDVCPGKIDIRKSLQKLKEEQNV